MCVHLDRCIQCMLVYICMCMYSCKCVWLLCWHHFYITIVTIAQNSFEKIKNEAKIEDASIKLYEGLEHSANMEELMEVVAFLQRCIKENENSPELWTRWVYGLTAPLTWGMHPVAKKSTSHFVVYLLNVCGVVKHHLGIEPNCFGKRCFDYSSSIRRIAEQRWQSTS